VKVLRETSGPKTEEVIKGWRRLHNEEPYDLYCTEQLREYKCMSYTVLLSAQRNGL
jgi:hypothetical protein